MSVTSLIGVIDKFGETTKSPTIFLNTDTQLSTKLKSNIKEVYDFGKKEEIETRSKNSLSQLLVKNFNSEQIWQQLELQNEEVLTTSTNMISVLLAGTDKLFFNNLDTKIPEKQKENDSNSESDCTNSDEDLKKNEIDSFLNDANQIQDDSSENMSSDNDEKKSAKTVGIEDDFFKLSEMEDFLKKEEKKLEDPDDHSESDDSEEEGSIQLFEENSDSSQEEENVAKTARFKDYFVAKDKIEKKSKSLESLEERIEDDSEDDNGEQNNGTKSNFELRQQRLKEKMKKFDEQAISEKPWQLRGEITAENRPQNSLLEEVVSFDLTSRPAPVITEQTSLQLEDIIRQRIKNKAFDSVERKNKPIETPTEYRKKLVLDQEKSKHSLAQIYENEYIEQQAALGQDNSEKEEQEPDLHKEVKTLMTKLFTKLDSLSNFHFTSKPSVPELKIVGNLPAINMEEVAPVTTSDATLLAPEEIKTKPKELIIGKNERTTSDKKKERRHKKLKQKIHSRLKLKKENEKNVNTKPKNNLVKDDKRTLTKNPKQKFIRG